MYSYIYIYTHLHTYNIFIYTYVCVCLYVYKIIIYICIYIYTKHKFRRYPPMYLQNWQHDRYLQCLSIHLKVHVSCLGYVGGKLKKVGLGRGC